MKNVWIIHNSKYGNSEKLSNEIAVGIKDKFNVKVGSIKRINPKEIAEDNPEAIIIGGRIIAFNTDRKLTKFIKNLDIYFKKPIPKIATFYTHSEPWTDKFSRGMRKALEKTTCIGDSCPEILDVAMQKSKGPAAEGQEEKIQNYIKNLLKFLTE
ncbi:MAG: flavodoxin domain-containing protein [Promethearchaeota archaeon]